MHQMSGRSSTKSENLKRQQQPPQQAPSPMFIRPLVSPNVNNNNANNSTNHNPVDSFSQQQQQQRFERSRDREELLQMFQRSQSSRAKMGTETAATPTFPLVSPNGEKTVAASQHQQHQQLQQQSHPSRSLVKNIVSNFYENNCVPSSPNMSASRSSFRSSVNHGQSNANSQSQSGNHHLQRESSTPSNSTSRSFAFKPSVSADVATHQQHVYDNAPSPSTAAALKNSSQFSHSPSLDRKSITRASLPVNYRSGSAMSSGSSNAGSMARGDNSYGVINSQKNLNSADNKTSSSISIGSITWIEILEPKSKTKMFANLSSGECRWEEPKGVPVLRANNPNVVQWWELFDPKTQRFYYYSAKDYKTIWQKPTSSNAVIVPLAKLQIMKHNSQHPYGGMLTESFDSGAGNSSGHVTPNSPSLSSPNHTIGSSRLKWNAFQGPFGPVSAPAMADSATQTAHSAISRPMMVSRWTQTSNQTPSTIRYPTNSRRGEPNGVMKQSHEQSVHHDVSSKPQPSLQHYLLSEARFARGRLPSNDILQRQQQMQQQQYQEDLYDQVYGQTNDFYDVVAVDNHHQHQQPATVVGPRAAAAGGNNVHNGNLYYEDVYEGGDDLLYDEYYDEFLDDDDEDFDESDFSCDADDEFVDGSIGTEEEDDDDDEDDDDEDEEDDDIIDDNDSEYHFDRDSFEGTRSSQDGSTEFLRQNFSSRQHQKRLNKEPTTIGETVTQQQQPHSQQQLSPNKDHKMDGIRMSASFTACDFKRNALGRSSYTPAMSQQYQQQHQQMQQQAYSNPFNSGSLRSSTSRIPNASNIADRINLFNKVQHQLPSPQPPPPQQTPSPLVVHRIAANQAASSTPVDRSSVNQQNVQNYFQQQRQSSPPSQQQAQAPSKSHSMTAISANNVEKNEMVVDASLSRNIANMNLENYYHMPPPEEERTPLATMYHNTGHQMESSSGTPKLPKRNYPLTKVHSTNSVEPSPIEHVRNRTLNHSLSLGGPTGAHLQIHHSPDDRSNSQLGGVTFPSFDDSHLIMLNKSNQQHHQQPTVQGKKKTKTEKSEKTQKTKKPSTNENKIKSTKVSPKKGELPSNTSIESFAKENVARHRKGGIFSKKKTLKSMLTHTKKPLKKPMISTISDALLVKESVHCFKLIQIFMGDRPASPQQNPDQEHDAFLGTLSDEILLLNLINVCVQLVPLRDEVLVQVARQVTQNPSPESEQRGLELMCVLLWYFTASNKLSAHLQAFLSGHRNPFTPVVKRKFEQQAHRARHTHSHLFFRKPHSTDEVARVLRCVRTQHSGLFGETLSDGLIIKELIHAVPESKRAIPWPLVMLSEALLETRHEDREGMFRCVGDMDDVHRLKMKIDTALQSDPKFLDCIGYGNRKAQKLTDAHDLHVIASTLKLYFRELREAAIPAELYNEALDCAHVSGKACAIIDRLSSVNKNSLYYLINFLQVFSKPEYVRDTKMDDANLSMVWAPNLLRSLNPNNLSTGPSAMMLLNSTKSANIYEQTRAEMSLIRTLIQHLDTKAA